MGFTPFIAVAFIPLTPIASFAQKPDTTGGTLSI